MSTITATRPKTETSGWSKVFPPSQINVAQSTLFMKKLLAVAVSNISYIRNIFPECAFGDRQLENLGLKILRADSNCPGATTVVKWMKGCFDAIEKKYLKTIVIGMFTDPAKPDHVIESYTFKFSYNEGNSIDIYRNDQIISSASGAEDSKTKIATMRLLRTIVVLTQSLENLPKKILMSMKLYYYDEVTPEDYEPPGFEASDSGAVLFDDEAVNIKLGDVSTPFHMVSVRVKTSLAEAELPAKTIVDDSNDTLTQHDLEVTSISTSDQQVVPKSPAEAAVPDAQNPGQPVVAEDKAVVTAGSVVSSAADEDQGVRCACGCNEDDGLMIQCGQCNFWCHGWCYLIRKEEDAPPLHICDLCAKAELRCTDPTLENMNEINKQALCLWRRALMACMDLNRVLSPMLSKRLGIEVTVAQGLINRMEREGFLNTKSRSKRFGKTVDKTKLAAGIDKYFIAAKAAASPCQEPEPMEEDLAPVISKQEENINEVRKPVPSEQEKGLKENSNEVVDISAFTESLNLSMNSSKKAPLITPPQQVIMPVMEEPQQVETKGKKRARGIPKGADLVDSQDDSVIHPRKKRKCSRTVKYVS